MSRTYHTYKCGTYAQDYIVQDRETISGRIFENRNHTVTGTGVMTNYNIFRTASTYSDSYDIREGITELGDGCLSKYTINHISLPNSLIKIGSSCFEQSSILSIVLPDSLVEMGHNNFPSTLSSITLPANLKIFPTDNIYNCKNMTAIDVDKDNNFFKSIDGILYNHDVTEILICPRGKAGKVIVPPTVKHIADYCFSECNNITSIELPRSIASIGSYAFSKLTLDRLYIPNNVVAIGEGCFLKTTIRKKFRFPQITILPDKCFKEAKFPHADFLMNIEVIGNHCFESIKKESLPSELRLPKVKNIGEHAFDSVKFINSIELSSCIQHIGEGAFSSTAKDLNIILLSMTPLKANLKAFSGLSNNAALYVPAGSRIVFERSMPWSTFSHINEFELEKDINDENVEISDEHLYFRLQNIVSSFDNADRYFLKETLEDVALYYQNVDNDDDYNEAIQLIQYNRMFNPPLIPNLDKKFFAADWLNKYKLKFANHCLMNNSYSLLAIPTQDENHQVEELKTETIQQLPDLELIGDITSLTQETDGEVEVHFSDILRHLQNELSLATKSIKIAVSWFTNFSLFKQIKEIANDGAYIQIIINNDLINNGGYCLNLNELIEAGVHISLVEYPHLIHHKFCIIDDKTVINGSYNWTRFSENNYENIMIFRNNNELCEDFNEEFERILNLAEHKDIKAMPDSVPQRPEYDRSAFKQYITEELDAEARQTSDLRDKITALQKAAKLNAEYLEKINPEVKKKYKEEFKVIEQSESMAKTFVKMVRESQPASKDSSSKPQDVKKTPKSQQTKETAKSTTVKVTTPAVSIMPSQEVKIIQQIKASNLFMALDASGSMKQTYEDGHVTNIAKKCVSAALTLSESQKLSLWEFGSDANLIGEIGIENISTINNVHCKNQGTQLEKFVSKADTAIKDNSLVIVFTDDDGESIKDAVPGMKKRTDVFWQVIVYGDHAQIDDAIKDNPNISLVSMTDYASKTDEEITKALLKDYINWKQ